jgi:hypothetical protein
MATFIHNNPPESHLTSQPTMAEVPSNYLSQCVLSLHTMSVYVVHVRISTCMQTCTTPLHIFVFSLTAFLAACLCSHNCNIIRQQYIVYSHNCNIITQQYISSITNQK